MARRSYLTTFEISRICEVSPTTVQNWIREGKLKAHLTPGGHRRVLRADLTRFMREFGIPIPRGIAEAPPFILIVDDDRDMIELLTEALHSGDREVDVAGTQGGVEALLIIGERKPDLLILDVLMPGMNGIEVCRKLKESPHTGNLRIVAISGDHGADMRERILAAGADRFFTKPFDLAGFCSECLSLVHITEAR